MPGVPQRAGRASQLPSRPQARAGAAQAPRRRRAGAAQARLTRQAPAGPRPRSFCDSCISAWLLRRPTCPVDREPLDRTAPNLGLRSAVGALRLRCPRGVASRSSTGSALAAVEGLASSPNGWEEHVPPQHCWWSGALDALPAHLDLCALTPVRCPFAGCGQRPPRFALAAHRSRCEFATVSCMHCGEDYVSGLHFSHDAACPALPARCPHDGCCVMLPRSALGDHARGCMLRRVPCPLPGCGALVPVAALWQHLAWPEPRHVYLLAMQYCALESSLSDATSRLAQAHLEHHAAALTPQHEEVERLRAQNAALRQRLAAYEPPADPEPGSDEEEADQQWYVEEAAGAAAVPEAAPQAEDAAAAPDASEEEGADAAPPAAVVPEQQAGAAAAAPPPPSQAPYVSGAAAFGAASAAGFGRPYASWGAARAFYLPPPSSRGRFTGNGL